MSISVLIMTLNEERNLPICLESLSWCDDIVILDSFSSDRTVEIAKAAGARVYQRAYDTEDRQRMYGIKQIKFKYNWVYTPDADEVTPPDLRDEMLAIANDPSRREAYFLVRYKNMFMGRWIKHSSLYPTWMTRFVRPDRVIFEREVHSKCISSDPCGFLQSHYIHYSFNNGLKAWYDKHNVYSTVEARATLESLDGTRVEWLDIFRRDPVKRRKNLKEMSMRLPFRPQARFVYMYFLRGGFLDGGAGYHYCRLLAAYEYMIVIKVRELRRRQHGLSV